MAHEQQPPKPHANEPRLSLAEEQRRAFEADRVRGSSRRDGGSGLLGHIFRN